MSISNSLNNALSGLTAASRAAEVVSSNLSNALTDGYGRRELDLSAQQIGGRGAGVRIDGVSRMVDRGVIADRRMADAAVAKDDAMAEMLRRIETSVGKVGDVNGLQARLTAVEDAIVSASADPSSEVRLRTLVDSFNDLTSAFQTTAKAIQTEREIADDSIAEQVETLNRSLKQVEALNADIFRANQFGSDPSALMDQRQRVIDDISEIVPVKEMQRSGDRVALMTTTGQILLDGPPAEIGFSRTPTIIADMTFAAGSLGGLTINGNPISGGPLGKLSGGSLEAAFTARDETLVGFQTGLDGLAVDLIERFEGAGVDPTLTAGNPGLLTDGGAALDLTDTIGIAGRLELNATVDPDRGGALFRLRDGVEATAPGPVGDASLFNSMIGAMNELRTDAGGAVNSASGFLSNFVSEVGRQRVSSEEELGFSTARWETIKQTELADGVDTDFEMQMLLRIEETYAANARVIETINVMMRTLMEI